jgi:hypothetical protein
VIASVPTGSDDVLNVAVLVTPPLELNAAVPSAVVPSINVTEPVGAAYRLPTDAVSVTDCPAIAGFSDEVTVPAVFAAFTTSFSTEDVDPPKLPVAAYTAVIPLVPTGSDESVNTAVLLVPLPAASVAVPSVVEPLMNVTEPVGAVLALAIVAVKVTGCL